ncbi:tetratricopeptide repeat protein, partial [bacterium]|nr:tetratricopeptide repeat protein [bacterium]
MMKKFFQSILYIGIVLFLFQNPHGLVGQTDIFFHEANQLYQEGNYSAAVESYQNILDTGYDSGSIYYNMGNCYYKMQNIGYAILYYERAKRLIPGDEDLKLNLTLANLAVVDKINPQPEFIVFRVIQRFIHLFTQSILVIIVMAFYLMTIFSLVVWIISKATILPQTGYRLSILFGILF